MSTPQLQKSLKDFSLPLFDQAAALVPDDLKHFFSDRFDKRSEFLFPVLLFFYFAKKNLGNTKLYRRELIDGRNTYRLKLGKDCLWLVLTFGNKHATLVSERELCSLKLYEDSARLELLMAQEEPTFDTFLPMLIINGLCEGEESIPAYTLMFQIVKYHSGAKKEAVRMSFFAELLYALNVLASTTKVYKVMPPNDTSGLGASYEAKKEEVKN